jgi:hypothetical protein
MVLGFNHNLTYKSELFHVQTEDSGVANPHIITLLYRGGVIISSKKTSYADILKMDCLETVVEELMKEQHKEMMRNLKAGNFDEKAFSSKPQLIENYAIPILAPEAAPIAEHFSSAASAGSSAKGGVSQLLDLPQKSALNLTDQQSIKTITPNDKGKVLTLDDAVLSFFGPREE